jgi:hypothetical protein
MAFAGIVAQMSRKAKWPHICHAGIKPLEPATRQVRPLILRIYNERRRKRSTFGPPASIALTNTLEYPNDGNEWDASPNMYHPGPRQKNRNIGRGNAIEKVSRRGPIRYFPDRPDTA